MKCAAFGHSHSLAARADFSPLVWQPCCRFPACRPHNLRHNQDRGCFREVGVLRRNTGRTSAPLSASRPTRRASPFSPTLASPVRPPDDPPKRESPLCPYQRRHRQTWRGKSEKCQQRSHAPQRSANSFDHLVGAGRATLSALTKHMIIATFRMMSRDQERRQDQVRRTTSRSQEGRRSNHHAEARDQQGTTCHD